MVDRSARTSRAQASMSRARLMDSVPPPPAGPSLASRQRTPEGTPRRGAEPAPEETGGEIASRVFPFDAELSVAELDERGKAGTPWAARARTLSRSSLSMNSRRMCYADRRVLVAVHRVDDEPLVLLGRVEDCRYESGGLYVIDLELLPLDEAETRVVFSRRPR